MSVNLLTHILHNDIIHSNVYVVSLIISVIFRSLVFLDTVETAALSFYLVRLVAHGHAISAVHDVVLTVVPQ